MTRDELVKKVTKFLWDKHHEWVTEAIVEEVVSIIGEECCAASEGTEEFKVLPPELVEASNRIWDLTHPDDPF